MYSKFEKAEILYKSNLITEKQYNSTVKSYDKAYKERISKTKELEDILKKMNKTDKVYYTKLFYDNL